MIGWAIVDGYYKLANALFVKIWVADSFGTVFLSTIAMAWYARNLVSEGPPCLSAQKLGSATLFY